MPKFDVRSAGRCSGGLARARSPGEGMDPSRSCAPSTLSAAPTAHGVTASSPSLQSWHFFELQSHTILFQQLNLC